MPMMLVAFTRLAQAEKPTAAVLKIHVPKRNKKEYTGTLGMCLWCLPVSILIMCFFGLSSPFCLLNISLFTRSVNSSSRLSWIQASGNFEKPHNTNKTLKRLCLDDVWPGTQPTCVNRHTLLLWVGFNVYGQHLVKFVRLVFVLNVPRHKGPTTTKFRFTVHHSVVCLRVCVFLARRFCIHLHTRKNQGHQQFHVMSLVPRYSKMVSDQCLRIPQRTGK